MRKITMGLIVGLLSLNVYSQDRPLNCDSTCLVPFNAVQSKTRTVYATIMELIHNIKL